MIQLLRGFENAGSTSVVNIEDILNLVPIGAPKKRGSYKEKEIK